MTGISRIGRALTLVAAATNLCACSSEEPVIVDAPSNVTDPKTTPADAAAPPGDPAVRVAASPARVKLAPGASVDIALDVETNTGVEVDLAVDNVPLGVSAVLDRFTTAKAAVMRVSIADATGAGTFALSLRAQAKGAIARTAVEVEVTPAEKSFDVAVAPASAQLAPGSAFGLALSVTRRGGFAGPITIALDAPPAGVSASPVVVPSTAASAVVNVVAHASAPVPTSGTLTLRASSETVGSKTLSVPYTLAFPPGSPDETFAPAGRSVVPLTYTASTVVTGHELANGGFVATVNATPSAWRDVGFARFGPTGLLAATVDVDFDPYYGNARGSAMLVGGSLAMVALHARYGPVDWGAPTFVRWSPFSGAAPVRTELVLDTTREMPAMHAAIAGATNGDAYLGFSNGTAAFYRMSSQSGAPVSSFGSGGRLQVDGFPFHVQKMAVVKRPFGVENLLVAGGDSSGRASVRCLDASSGAVLTSYGNQGDVELPVARQGGSRANVYATLADGEKLLVLVDGDAPSTHLVVRLRGDGTLDPTFGNAGKAMLSGVLEGGTVTDVRTRLLALQPDGKIVIGTPSQDGNAALLIRLTAAGALDTSFGAAGRVTVATATQGWFAIPLSLSFADGRMTVLAAVPDAMVVARFWQ